MNRKNTFLTAIILISLFTVTLSVNATPELREDELLNPGTTPDSPLYFLKTWKESIQTFFIFGLENKARQYLHLAEVRLAEYQKMIDKGKTKIAEKTLAKYEKQLNRALEKAETMKQKGKETKDLTQNLGQTVSRHLKVLEKNLEKAPEQARKGIEKALEASDKALRKIKGPKSETNLIEVFTPKPNEVVKSPIKIEGKARGTWFFEGSFSIKLLDKNGKELGTAIAQAQGEWMTEDFVNFKATLEFGETEAEKGTLVFERQRAKDNESAAELKMPVVFTGKPKKDETAGWKTYRNEEFRFEVKYPETIAGTRIKQRFIFQEFNPGPSESEIFVGRIGTAEVPGLHLIGFRIVRKPSGFVNLDTHLKEVKDICQEGISGGAAGGVCNIKKMTVGNEEIPAIVSTESSAVVNTSVFLYFDKGSDIFLISYDFARGMLDAGDTKEKILFDTIQKILSTFRFTR